MPRPSLAVVLLLALGPSLVLVADAHPVHQECEPQYDQPFDVWLVPYLDQLIGGHPEDPIEGDVLSGILYVNQCHDLFKTESGEPLAKNVCDRSDTRSSEGMINDWAAEHEGEVVQVAVPVLRDHIGECWR